MQTSQAPQNTQSRERLYLIITLFLLVLACLLSAYLTYDHYQLMKGEDFQSICTINSYLNCDAVNTSRFSELFGFPIASWGLAYYLFSLVLIMMAINSSHVRREVGFILLPLQVLSIGTSIFLIIVSVSLIKALCLFCTALHVIHILLLITTFCALKDYCWPVSQAFKKVHRTRLFQLPALGLLILGITLAIAATQDEELPFQNQIFEERYASQTPIEIPDGESPVLGSSLQDAKIQLVEFSDFECPFCGIQAKLLHGLFRKFGSEIRFVFKNYPLDMSCNPDMKNPMHQQSCKAARAAWCANRQGKFDVFHMKLFHNQKEISDAKMRQWAEESQLDLPTFEVCLGSQEAFDAVLRDIELARSLKVNSTPTFFIDGRKMPGLVTEQTIQYLLQRKK